MRRLPFLFARVETEPMTPSPQIRQPCPPGACDCGRERLLETAGSDLRILRLTRQEEKRLLERLENIENLGDLEKLQQRMYEQLGIRLAVAPGFNEVLSMRGIAIRDRRAARPLPQDPPDAAHRHPPRPGETPGDRLPAARCP